MTASGWFAGPGIGGAAAFAGCFAACVGAGVITLILSFAVDTVPYATAPSCPWLGCHYRGWCGGGQFQRSGALPSARGARDVGGVFKARLLWLSAVRRSWLRPLPPPSSPASWRVWLKGCTWSSEGSKTNHTWTMRSRTARSKAMGDVRATAMRSANGCELHVLLTEGVSVEVVVPCT